jgi:cysteinyl-tRNA synthetase
LSARDIAKKYEEIFIKFFQDLRVDPFTIMPRATEHIKEQIDLVMSLEAK